MGWFDWFQLQVSSVNVTRAIAIFFGLFLCSQKLSRVVTLDALLTFITTAWIAVSKRDWLTSAIVSDRPIDALHEFLLTNVIAIMMVPALVWFLSTDPADITIRTGIALTRTMASGVAMIVTIVFQRLESQLKDEALQHMMAIMLTVMLVYTTHLIYNNAVNADRRPGNMNSFLRVDLILSVLCGAICLFMPNLPADYIFEQKLDGLHTYLYRLYGTMLLGFCWLPYIAPRFRASANKRAVLFSKALSMLMMMLVAIRRYRAGVIPEGLGGQLLIAALFMFTLPSAIGCMRHEHSSGWEVPWHGLRVPHVCVGGRPTDNILNAAKDLTNLSKVSPKRRLRLMGRSVTRSTSRRKNSRRRRRGRRSHSRR